MKITLEVRRQKLLKELGRVNRQIVLTQQQLDRLETRLTQAGQPREKAA